MIKSSGKVSSSKKNQPKKSNFNSKCRALILLNSNKIKQDEEDKCKDIYDKIDSLKKIIEFHESQNVTQYRQWLNSKFADQLTKIRILETDIQELLHTVKDIEDLHFCSGMSYQKAYETVIMMKKKLKDYEEKFHQQREEFKDLNDEELHKKFQEQKAQAEEFYTKSENEFKEKILRSSFESLYGSQKQWRSKKKSYEEAFEEFKKETLVEDFDDDLDEDDFFDFEANDDDENIFCFNSKKQQNKNKELHLFLSDDLEELPNQNLRLKELYRSMARQLHPDINPNLDSKKLDLWYQVQTAYEENDLSKLEVLSALSNMFDQSWNKIDSISMLKKLSTELNQTLSQLEKKIRSIKKCPSWDFLNKQTNSKKIHTFEERSRVKLSKDLSTLALKQRNLQDQLDSWSKRSGSVAKRGCK
ncbi:MAG: hypothetical protein K2X69_04230 [Silvanigrellaceae bacterium]|nr:hypothetical protein [Silvanigrellaceae bacterium]